MKRITIDIILPYNEDYESFITRLHSDIEKLKTCFWDGDPNLAYYVEAYEHEVKK